MALDAPSYAAGRTLLSLDQQEVGFVRSFEGGAVAADVLHEPVGATPFIKKHLGALRYEDIVLELGFSMDPRVYEWITATWAMNQQGKDGALVFCDNTLEATSKLEFFDSLITETTIPACDAASKEAGYLRLKVTPWVLDLSSASGKVGGAIGSTTQKTWLPCNFQLASDGLDCSKVTKIDSFTVKQTILLEEIGEKRELLRVPSRIEFPNLRATLSESGAQSWLEWHDNFVIKSNNDDSQERNGRLSFLAPNLQDELAVVRFFNLGIFRIASQKFEATKDQIKRIVADLYCERMELQFPSSVA